MSTTRVALPPIVIALLAMLGGGALVALGALSEPEHAAIAVAMAGGLLVPVPVPWGGSVPTGVAAVTATTALLDPAPTAATLGVALVLGAVLVVCTKPGPDALATTERFAAGLVAAFALEWGLAEVVGGAPIVARVGAAAFGLFLADVVLSALAPRPEHRIAQRSAVAVHLTLACAGALMAVAVAEVGAAMAMVAAFPLLITRFSFQRYAGATETLQETVQALGLVPELAGLAPLGHSERSAAYAVALSRELRLDRAETTRVVTATRLHHLGAVPYEADVEHLDELAPGDLAASGARILREAGFPNDVADLLDAARADAIDASAPSIEAAIVRVAATFDEIVGDDAAATDRGLALVSAGARDPHSRRVAAALLELVATEADLVTSAIAAGDRFRDAAVGVDLQAVTSRRHGAAELLPFTRRA